MVLSFSDIIATHNSVKYTIFLGAMVVGDIPFEVLGVTIRVGEFISYPFMWALNGLGILISFELFYILMFVLFLVIFTLSMGSA